MQDDGCVLRLEVGALRVFLSPLDRRRQRGLRAIFAKPLYRQIVDAAHRDGILNATSFRGQYGFGGLLDGYARSPEPTDHLRLCVELIAERKQLERFCQAHQDLLAGKVLLYAALERWAIERAKGARDDAQRRSSAA